MTSLATAVLHLAPVEHRQTRSYRLSPPPAVEPTVIDGLFAAAGLRRPNWTEGDGGEQGVFDRMADAALVAALDGDAAAPADPADPAAAVREARQDSVWSLGRSFEIQRPDGLEITGIACGTGESPVLVLGAPGLPLELVGPWLRALGERHPVAAWQTRGLFGRFSAPDVDMRGSDLGMDAQVGDAVAVLDQRGWARANLVGLCGGAAVALAVAAAHPERVGGLSLWLGDFETGSDEAKSDHQRNLQALMDMAVAGSIGIDHLHQMMLSTMTGLSAPDLAPLAVYPYATPDLLLKYCRMNSAVMGLDCRSLLPEIGAPAQVVASRSDTTVHPAGSTRVAEGLGVVATEITGHDHLGIFRAPGDCVELALRFLSDPGAMRSGVAA